MTLGVTLTTATALFAGTNLDDLVVLAVLNVCATTEGRPARWQIWVGQYIGLACLVGLSLLATLGLTLIPKDRTWLLGIVPLGLGIHKLAGSIHAARSPERETSPVMASGLGGVIAITVANGGDNVVAYTPFFRTSTLMELAVTLAVFAIGVALFCSAGALLVSHPRVTEAIKRWGHWIVPGIFIAIGVYVFYKGGAFGNMTSR